MFRAIYALCVVGGLSLLAGLAGQHVAALGLGFESGFLAGAVGSTLSAILYG